MTHQQQTAFENIVGKEEIARNEQFLLFSQCFLLNQIMVSQFVHIFDIISYFATELGEPKIGISGKELINDKISDLPKLKAFAEDTSNETQNLEICVLKGRKHCGKRRKCRLQAFSPFPYKASKTSFSRPLKVSIVWEQS